MKDQVPDPVKTIRSNRLLKLEKEQSKNFRSHYIGEETEVLFEETKEINGELFWVGHTADYVKVAIKTDQNMANCLKKVFVTEFLTDEILKCNSFD